MTAGVRRTPRAPVPGQDSSTGPVPSIFPVMPGGPVPHVGGPPEPYPEGRGGVELHGPAGVFGAAPENPVVVDGKPGPGGPAAEPTESNWYMVFFGSGDPVRVPATEWVKVLQSGRSVRIMARDLRAGDAVPDESGVLRTVDRVRAD